MSEGPTMYEDRVLRLVDLVNPNTSRLENTTFINCQINGPGIFFPEGGSMSNSSFDTPDIEAVLWEVPPDSFKIGAMHLVNCVFEKCRFSGLGMVANPQMAEYVRSEFSKP